MQEIFGNSQPSVEGIPQLLAQLAPFLPSAPPCRFKEAPRLSQVKLSIYWNLLQKKKKNLNIVLVSKECSLSLSSCWIGNPGAHRGHKGRAGAV